MGDPFDDPRRAVETCRSPAPLPGETAIELSSGVTPNWLSGMDSNHDKELQRLLCYHYTTGQQRPKIASPLPRRKGKTSKEKRPFKA